MFRAREGAGSGEKPLRLVFQAREGKSLEGCVVVVPEWYHLKTIKKLVSYKKRTRRNKNKVRT
jgi:hypothetical protein